MTNCLPLVPAHASGSNLTRYCERKRMRRLASGMLTLSMLWRLCLPAPSSEMVRRRCTADWV